jgi:hypothetical protein
MCLSPFRHPCSSQFERLLTSVLDIDNDDLLMNYNTECRRRLSKYQIMRNISGESMDREVVAKSDDWIVDMEEHGDIVYG